MADVTDISLHRHLTSVVDRLLDERGLSFFLKAGGRAPFSLEPRRIHLAVQLAARKAGREPAEAARKSAFDKVRRRLIGELAKAMVGVGL